MFKNFELTFNQDTSEYVKSVYGNANVIMEYGSGGSTLFGARSAKKVITTESDCKWLIELMGAYREQNLPGDIIPIWVDIGETKEWGHPVDESQRKNWPIYSIKAWHYCREHDINPDVILIDGRFRVACFLASCIYIRSQATVLFDDFASREYYWLVKEIAPCYKTIGQRMAVFQIEPGMLSADKTLDLLQYFYTPL